MFERQIQIVKEMDKTELIKMVEYGYAHNFSVVSSPFWDKNYYEDFGDVSIRDDILTSISEGNDWSKLLFEYVGD